MLAPLERVVNPVRRQDVSQTDVAWNVHSAKNRSALTPLHEPHPHCTSPTPIARAPPPLHEPHPHCSIVCSFSLEGLAALTVRAHTTFNHLESCFLCRGRCMEQAPPPPPGKFKVGSLVRGSLQQQSQTLISPVHSASENARIPISICCVVS